jgi:hypothetical protein
LTKSRRTKWLFDASRLTRSKPRPRSIASHAGRSSMRLLTCEVRAVAVVEVAGAARVEERGVDARVVGALGRAAAERVAAAAREAVVAPQQS